MDLAGTVVIGAGCNMNKILSTLVLCRAVISVNDSISNLWHTGIITFFIIELYEVSKTCIVEYMIVFFPFDNVSPNIIHLSQLLTIVSSHTFLSSLK